MIRTEQILGKGILKTLRWWDILVLTAILFGTAIRDSAISYLASVQGSQSFESALVFTTADNLHAIRVQCLLLLLALLYLRIRQFDFSSWKIRIGLKATAGGILLFLAMALTMDLFLLAADSIGALPVDAASASAGADAGAAAAGGAAMDWSLILFSLLNGFYEEIYFLGMCLSVPKRFVKWAFLFSLAVRFSFHTYQGIAPAAGIALIVGITNCIIYEKTGRKNLWPFFLSHAVADVLGLGILRFLM